MAKSIWTQYRAIVHDGFIDVSFDAVMSDNDDWGDFQTAYHNYRTFKDAGLNAKIQIREVMFGNLKEGEIESRARMCGLIAGAGE